MLKTSLSLNVLHQNEVLGIGKLLKITQKCKISFYNIIYFFWGQGLSSQPLLRNLLRYRRGFDFDIYGRGKGIR